MKALSILGKELDTSPAAFGELARTSPSEDLSVIRARMDEMGYVFFPGFFDREVILEVRRELVRRLGSAGALEPRSDPMDAIARRDATLPDLGRDNEKLVHGNEPLLRALYSGQMIEFWEAFLGGPVRHFDHTWLRVQGPGSGTYVHTDVVFMSRGTRTLFTAWVPYGDVPRELGGLAILEKSHQDDETKETYGRQDVDTFCENFDEAPRDGYGARVNPVLTDEPALFARQRGGRWLTTDYRAGDLLVFGMYTAHGALDNQTDRIRLSSDSRYQLASEPIDDRWIGPNPKGHGKASKRGIVC